LIYPTELKIVNTGSRIHFYAHIGTQKFIGSFTLSDTTWATKYLFEIRDTNNMALESETGLFIESSTHPNILLGPSLSATPASPTW